MLEIKELPISCGVKALVGVHSLTVKQLKDIVEKGLCYIYKDLYYSGRESGTEVFFQKGFAYTFSDNSSGHATKLVDLIKNYELGELHETGWFVNENMRNQDKSTNINVWTWVYNGKKGTYDEKFTKKVKRVVTRGLTAAGRARARLGT